MAGLVQGGGFGSFSKEFGLAAASLLEAEIVTADGVVRKISAHNEPDLFWAVKGGGGGTFGAVTRLTLATHALPATFGIVSFTVTAKDADAFKTLLLKFARHYRSSLFNRHWGEHATASPDNELEVMMLFQGLEEPEALAVWQPFLETIRRDGRLQMAEEPTVLAFPARRLWDADYWKQRAPDVVTHDTRPGKSANWWFSGDGGQAGAQWHGYGSLWLPASNLDDDRIAAFAERWHAASRHHSVELHFNKGLAGGSGHALAGVRETSINPVVAESFALAIAGARGRSGFEDQGERSNAATIAEASDVQSAIAALRPLNPSGGSYRNETDFHLEDWSAQFWGQNEPRLVQVKRRWDPDNLFGVHHGIGTRS